MQACKIKELVAGGGLLAWKYHLGAGTAVDDIVRGVLLVQLNTNKVTNNVGRTVSLPGCTRSLTDRTTTSAKCVLICVELYLGLFAKSLTIHKTPVQRINTAVLVRQTC